MFRRLTLPLLAFLSFPAVASAGVPTNTVQPTVSGTPQVTQTLTRTLGTWSNSPTSYTTAWQRCTQKSGGLSCRNNIAGATGATYVIVSADVGFKLRVNITATNADGSKSRASAATAVVTNPAATPPNNTAKPTVSGTPQVGNALTASNGTWSGTTPITYAYQWQRAGTNIFGAISSRYTLTNADVGSTIEVVVMATNSLGTASATSAPTGVVVSSGGGSWPASYTNGPLGANEVLPNSNGGVLLSLWSGVVGFTSQQSRSLVQRRIADMGRVPDVIGFSCSGSCAAGSGSFDASSTDLSENWIHSQGAIPLVANWDPGSSTNFAGIAAGNYDSQVDASAARFKAFGHRIMVRMFPEFSNNSWNATDFINAWRHIVNRFKADGATNVGFWWCPGEQAGGVRPQIDASYPGDAYVDWVGSDDYNRDSSGAYSACRNGWVEWSWEFNYDSGCGTLGSTEQEWGPRKPFVDGETGSKYDTAGVPSGHTVDPNRKANWYRHIPSAASQMPYLIGVDFFDQDVHALEAGNDWMVDSKCDSAGNNCTSSVTDATTYQGFKDMSHAAAFNVGAAGGVS